MENNDMNLSVHLVRTNRDLF